MYIVCAISISDPCCTNSNCMENNSCWVEPHECMTSPLMAEKRLTGPPTGSAGPGPHRTIGDTFSFLMESEPTVLLNDRAIVKTARNTNLYPEWVTYRLPLEPMSRRISTISYLRELPFCAKKRGYPTRYWLLLHGQQMFCYQPGYLFYRELRNQRNLRIFQNSRTFCDKIAITLNYLL